SLVLNRLAVYADERGVAFPSLARLAFEAKVTRRHIRRALRELQKAGVLHVRPRYGHATSVYTLLVDVIEALPDIAIERPRVSRLSSSGGTPVSERGDTQAPQRGRQCPPNGVLNCVENGGRRAAAPVVSQNGHHHSPEVWKLEELRAGGFRGRFKTSPEPP